MTSTRAHSCLIQQTDCGRISEEPICPKCGLDERMRYINEEAATLAKSQGLENYKAVDGSKAMTFDWGFVDRPRLPGGIIDVDNESFVIAEDLDWGTPPSYRGVLEAGRRRIERIKNAAESGDTTAKLILGRMLLEGIDTLNANPTQAHVLYREALDSGNEAACSFIGALYENGESGLPQDETKARTWYERGAAADDARSIAFLADFYAEGKAGLERNENKALEMLKNAAVKGSGYALFILGQAIREGKWGMKIDNEHTAQLFNLALARGYGHSALPVFTEADVENLFRQNNKTLIERVACGSLCTFSGEADPLKIFSQIIEGCLPNLVINESGNEWTEVDESDVESQELMLISIFAWAQFGIPNAMYFVAQRLCFKKNPINQAEAVKWLQCAAQDGHPAAMYFYGRLLIGVDIGTPSWPWVRENLPSEFCPSMNEGKQWLERAAELDQSFAMFDLGVWLTLTGEAEDQASSVYWLEKAAQANFNEAYRWLTMMHSQGFRDKWIPNLEAAKRYCRLGAEAGVPYCMERLGATLYSGKKYGEALRWLSAAAEAGVSQAFFGMAAYHFNGKGPQSDPAQALEWAQRGAEADVPEAMHVLGLIYWTGNGGVSKNLVLAEQWLQKAVEMNVESARLSLDSVQQELLSLNVEKSLNRETKKGFWSRLFSS